MKRAKTAKQSENTVKGSDFLNLGLIAFAGLGMEVIYAYFLEPVVYGATMENWSPMQTILHWLLTCITWGIVAVVLIQKAEKKYQFPMLEKGAPMGLRRWVLCFLLILLAFGADYMDWGGFKVYIEFIRRGPLLFFFQYLYYAFETLLFLLIIVFGQKACEIWFHRPNVPYGGIICGLTWGLAHIFTKNLFTGLAGLILGFAMGGIYLLANRDLKKAYLLLFVMFIV